MKRRPQIAEYDTWSYLAQGMPIPAVRLRHPNRRRRFLRWMFMRP